MKFARNDRALLERRRELRRNQTEAEKLVWRHIRNRQLHGLKFFRQYSLGVYILDFYCPERKVAIEIDGGHHALDGNREYDAARSQFLQSHGIHVLRFWNSEVVTNIYGVLEKLVHVLAGASG